MSEVQTGGGEKKKGKPQKLNLRVDFTPMVDMNMLLITFFMFCTTLSKPQIMDIAMPTNDENLTEEEKDKVPESKTVTLLLGENDKVYYYFGKPKYEDYTSLKETDYSPEGIRGILLERNAAAVQKMTELKREKRENKRMSDEDFKKQASEIKNDKESMIVVIKPTSDATYENLVDALDEMQICSIGKYAIVDMAEGDQFLIENLKTKGAYGAQAATPK
ncbi:MULTISPECIES: ExbD/TolR family protein [unclassified Dysgonomonas]|uniref:ExbD/TolR family protein n=1 Tax=unclassified Dysgonomonas TaxID=2630389 RepID=UPI0013EBBC8B|nr:MULTISPECIES: biopolymer transporter ExbD [unclassified Dysgonomonas]